MSARACIGPSARRDGHRLLILPFSARNLRISHDEGRSIMGWSNGHARSGFIPMGGPPPPYLHRGATLVQREKPRCRLDVDTGLLSSSTMTAIVRDLRQQAGKLDRRAHEGDPLREAADALDHFRRARW